MVDSIAWLTGTDDELIGGLGLARGGMQGIPPERPPEKAQSHKEGKQVLVTVACLSLVAFRAEMITFGANGLTIILLKSRGVPIIRCLF
jgi:hypothetical protein